MPKQKAAIIGAGIGGIAIAIRLAVKGYKVEVFEANSYAGGKLSSIQNSGFHFDAGPSLFTMPQYIDELFTLAGKDPKSHFQYCQLSIVCKYFYTDGTRLTQFADETKTATEFEEKLGENFSTIHKFWAYSKRIYKITHHVFLERSLHKWQTYFSGRALWSLFNVFGIDAFRTMHRANSQMFKTKNAAQFFDRYATYNGSNPYQASATLNVIPHLENEYGAWFPEGGMRAITDSLVELASSLGVEINYGSPVQRIEIEGRRATGVSVNGKLINADVVVSNADVWFTYNKLLKDCPGLAPKRILKQKRSSSALIFYWGISRQFPQLDLHNVFFSADYKQEFDNIWKDKTICDDPTIYLNISSKYKADDAPPGSENWFVMINVPANEGQDWDELIVKARANIQRKLSGLLGEDISKLIVCENILDPRGIESKTSSYQGSIYGSSSNNKLAAFLRYANRSSKIKNLYFCGGSVHPGGGIPLVLLSARIVAEWVPDPA